MYQLLMAGVGWAPNRAALELGRITEHTSPTLTERFKPGGVLDLEALTTIPAVFTKETQAGQDHVARVGTITRARHAGREVSFEYTLDPDIPGIPNSMLMELRHELDIDEWEFSRTHWAFKDVDLFKVLLKADTATVLKPTAFHLDGAINKDQVCVMMPFDAAFNPVYDALVGAAGGLRMTCRRADNIWIDDVVIQDVVTLIRTSKVVICDLSGKNPNVFYETGIAHTLGSQVILITQTEADVPFDLRHIRFIRYLNNAEGRAQLAETLSTRLETLAAR